MKVPPTTPLSNDVTAQGVTGASEPFELKRVVAELLDTRADDDTFRARLKRVKGKQARPHRGRPTV